MKKFDGSSLNDAVPHEVGFHETILVRRSHIDAACIVTALSAQDNSRNYCYSNINVQT